MKNVKIKYWITVFLSCFCCLTACSNSNQTENTSEELMIPSSMRFMLEEQEEELEEEEVHRVNTIGQTLNELHFDYTRPNGKKGCFQFYYVDGLLVMERKDVDVWAGELIPDDFSILEKRQENFSFEGTVYIFHKLEYSGSGRRFQISFEDNQLTVKIGESEPIVARVNNDHGIHLKTKDYLPLLDYAETETVVTDEEKRKIVGSWSRAITDDYGKKILYYIRFNEDHSFVYLKKEQEVPIELVVGGYRYIPAYNGKVQFLCERVGMENAEVYEASAYFDYKKDFITCYDGFRFLDEYGYRDPLYLKSVSNESLSGRKYAEYLQGSLLHQFFAGEAEAVIPYSISDDMNWKDADGTYWFSQDEKYDVYRIRNIVSQKLRDNYDSKYGVTGCSNMIFSPKDQRERGLYKIYEDLYTEDGYEYTGAVIFENIDGEIRAIYGENIADNEYAEFYENGMYIYMYYMDNTTRVSDYYYLGEEGSEKLYRMVEYQQETTLQPYSVDIIEAIIYEGDQEADIIYTYNMWSLEDSDEHYWEEDSLYFQLFHELKGKEAQLIDYDTFYKILDEKILAKCKKDRGYPMDHVGYLFY